MLKHDSVTENSDLKVNPPFTYSSSFNYSKALRIPHSPKLSLRLPKFIDQIIFKSLFSIIVILSKFKPRSFDHSFDLPVMQSSRGTSCRRKLECHTFVF